MKTISNLSCEKLTVFSCASLNMSNNPDKSGIGPFQTEESEYLAHSLDIFTKPTKEPTLVDGKTVLHNPLNAIDVNGPIEFIIPSHSHNEYTLLPMTRLEGELKIVNKNDGSNLAQDADVSFCNLLASSLFKQVECEINGIQINDVSTSTYAYKAYLETLLSYGKAAKDSHLGAALWIDDEKGKEDRNLIAESSALTKRNKLIGQSKAVYFSTPLHIDFFHTPRLLPPGCNLKIKMLRNEDDFSLIAANSTYSIKITDLKLYTRKIIVHDSIISNHDRLFDKLNAVYPIAMSQIKTFVLSSGISNQTFSNIFRGKLPRQIIFGLLENDSYNGAITHNPFLFKPFNLKYVALKKNGVMVPSSPFQPDFEKSKCVREYRHFIDSIGIGHENEGNGITFKQWKTAKNLWVYDFSPDLCNSYHTHTSESGYIDLDLAFSSTLSKTAILLVYGVFNTNVYINKERYPIIEKQD